MSAISSNLDAARRRLQEDDRPATGRLLTARHVAEQLDLTPETILAWVREGKLPAFRLPSGQIRFSQDALDEWLRERATCEQDSRLTVIRGEG